MQSENAISHEVQARYLRELLRQRRFSAQEVAMRSLIITQQEGLPELAFSRQAVTSWVNGTRVPRSASRHLLARILQVPLEEMNHKCGGVTCDLSLEPVSGEVNVRVYGRDDEVFGYNLMLSSETNLSQPAVYRHWGDIFTWRPAQLMRHFRGLKYKQYAWIPDDAASPLVLRHPCMVPLHTERLNLESEAVNERKIWFVYSPDHCLEFGVAYRENQSLVLLDKRHAAKKYPLSKIDLIGYVTGKTLFQVCAVSNEAVPARLGEDKISA